MNTRMGSTLSLERERIASCISLFGVGVHVARYSCSRRRVLQYSAVDAEQVLEPGVGYWVRLSAAGTLCSGR